ncbi:patatin-like phospholipase family protein [Paludibaculum fermentans]|uniref:patatin-like phospholipase family protein n=1 Tax=Paludibaculum fermentans TaxID=1473598 RepID=UPI003EBD7806
MMKPTRRDILQYSALGAVLQQSVFSQTRKSAGPAKYLILACDGGGMRGYLSSLILQRLNSECGILGEANGNVDLYAGTSTGGLIALGLAQGKSIDDVVTLYQNAGAQIFSPLGVQLTCAGAVAGCTSPIQNDPANGDTASAKELFQALFDNIGDPSLLSVLEAFIPEDPVLSSLPSKVMVATFQLADPAANPAIWSPLVIDNFDGSAGANTRLFDAALATSAAPVYFPPYCHPQFGWCSDGGLFANNPAALAVSLAIQQGRSLSNIAVLSIGTGKTSANIVPTLSDRLCFGVNRWASLKGHDSTPTFPLLNAMMDGVSDSTHALCSQLLGGGGPNGRYMRLNPALPASVALDDYSPETMQMFEQTAEAYFDSPDWAQVVQWAKSTFVKLTPVRGSRVPPALIG